MENLLRLSEEFLPEFQTEEELNGWRIKDDLTAEWAFDKIREIEAERVRMEMVINAKIKQLQEKLARENESAAGQIGFFENALYEYFKTVKTKDTKTQRKYKLPTGELIEKVQKPEFKRDSETLLAWAKGQGIGEYVRVKEEANWVAIKEGIVVAGDKVYHKETGDLVEGVILVERPPKFEIKL